MGSKVGKGSLLVKIVKEKIGPKTIINVEPLERCSRVNLKEASKIVDES